MGEQQFHFSFMETPEEQLDLNLPKKEDAVDEQTAELDLASLDREALEKLYFERVGKHRFHGRTDDEVRAAILDPDKEIDRLREIDRVDDAWADLGPTGK